MAQEAAFTSSAMATALENSSVSYEDLADIEKEFDDAETEIIRQQVALTAPLYVKRAEILSKIENFWPLVLEQAPPDIDQFIQPSDSALLLSSLTSLSVDNFEITSANKNGDPRSVAIKFEFSENEYFENKVLEKKFWYRTAADGWSGLVSEPVKINWKKDKDLTGGLLDLVIKAWKVEQSGNGSATKKGEPNDAQKALQKKIEGTGMGGLSFFSWFGFIGRRVTEEVSKEAIKREAAKRKGEKVAEDEPMTEEQEDQEDLEMSLEIFPDGDDLAIAIAEDLWPGAIKYFTQAQEQDALSDLDFESGDEDDEAGSFQGLSDDDEAPPLKKMRS